jgi:KUP system potassium uptake protein
MTSSNDGVPVVLLHHLKHNKVLHEQVILMSVVTREVPEISGEERVTVEKLEHGFARVTARYGFMEQPNVPEILQWARQSGIKARPNDTTFYLGRERIILSAGGERKPGTRRAPDDAVLTPMARWRKKLFVVMSRNARSATEFWITRGRVVELGAQGGFTGLPVDPIPEPPERASASSARRISSLMPMSWPVRSRLERYVRARMIFG